MFSFQTMITTLSFTTFAVDVTLTQNRLQLSFIVLLTGVTFKLASNQSLPKIPYLTHLVSIVQLFKHYIYSNSRWYLLPCLYCIKVHIFIGFKLICLFNETTMTVFLGHLLKTWTKGLNPEQEKHATL